jgi:hypothetical protein
MEENGGSAPPHIRSCPTKQDFFDHRCTQIQLLICVHLRASVVDFPCNPTVRPNAGSIFMVEQVNRLPPPVEGAHGGA